MSAPVSTGGTVRSQLENVWQQTGIKPAELVDNPLPEAVGHVWWWFLELNRQRRTGMVAPDPISYQEIKAWAFLTRREPTPFEVSCLCDLDEVILKAARKEK